MTSADGKLVVTFNGEIYNYRQLRAELEARGHRFRSQTDTEVLLHLYAEKGEAMVNDLRGMFAFGLWDAEKSALLLARDPYGIKPLYYADDGWTFRFASQVKALLAGGKVSRNQEPAGWVGFCLFGSVPEPFTTYQEIRALPAGSTASGSIASVRARLSSISPSPRPTVVPQWHACRHTTKISKTLSERRSSTACAIILWPTSRLARSCPAASTPVPWSA